MNDNYNSYLAKVFEVIPRLIGNLKKNGYLDRPAAENLLEDYKLFSKIIYKRLNETIQRQEEDIYG